MIAYMDIRVKSQDKSAKLHWNLFRNRNIGITGNMNYVKYDLR